jgi:hypothetical protein
MSSLLVLLIILGCAAYQFFKGTFVRACATVLIAICASVAAFGFFEILANVFISRSAKGSMISIVPWAQPLCFILLFILVFALLQTALMFLTRNPVDLGFLPERIGRVVCGIFLGLILSGVVLITLVMAPLPAKYPYQRFDNNRRKALLNTDGLVSGLFNIISNGSFSGKRSFATIHPDFLDQLYLNRQTSGTSVLTSTTPAIDVPRKAVWPAPDNLTEQVNQIVSELNRQGKLKDESTNKTISMPRVDGGNYEPTIVRIGIKKGGLRSQAKINGGVFTLSQLRLICKREGYGNNPLAGTAINIYPIGHLKAADQIQVSTEIKLDRNDFEENSREKFIDFVFCIPRDFVPVLLEFKQNNIVTIPSTAIASLDDVPPPAVFDQSSEN